MRRPVLSVNGHELVAASQRGAPDSAELELTVLIEAAEDATDPGESRPPRLHHRPAGWGCPLSTVEQLVLADPDSPNADPGPTGGRWPYASSASHMCRSAASVA